MRSPAALVLGLLLAAGVAAQPDDPAGAAYTEALAARAAGDAAATVAALREAVRADAAYVGAEGPAARLLGEALVATDPAAALDAWRAGRAALAAAGVVDVETEAAVATWGARLGTDRGLAAAADATLTLLANAPADRLQTILRALRLVVSDTDAAALGLDGGPVDAGAVVAWWRRQDPLPATPRNERLEEHLRRTAVALDTYGDGEGWMDDRGAVFVRLGPPARRETIRLDAGEFSRYVPSLVTSFRPSDVPRNEVWGYPSLHRSATYVFVAPPGRPFRLGEPEDIVPRSLRSTSGGSTRGRRRGEALLFALEIIYGQMAQFDPRYHGLWTDVSDYTNALDLRYRDQAFALDEARERAARGATVREANARFDASEGMLEALVQPPSVFARTVLGEATGIAVTWTAERDAAVPPAQSTVLAGVPAVPTALRASRFLTPTGETRLELDWSVGLEAVPLADSVYVGWTAIVQDAALAEVGRVRLDLLAPPTPEGSAFPVQSASVGLGGGAGVAAQWDVRAFAVGPDGRLRPGARVGLGAARVEPLAPLASAGFEVSDLRPVESVGRTPYPFARVAPGLPISMYFEVYGLDAERGQFTVEYAVELRSAGRLLRRPRREVEAEGRLMTQAVGGRSAQYLILNTAGWSAADEAVVGVVVRSRTGEEIRRSVRLVVAPDA